MNDSISFNLIEQAWIPCLRPGQRRPELLSLSDTLVHAHKLREIYADSPLVTASLYRLCLAVLHRSLDGPADRAAWSELWKRRDIGFDMEHIGAYLRKWHERFDLFGATPFYQVDYQPRKKKAGAKAEQQGKSVVFLMMGVDNNMATLFSHYTARSAYPLPLDRAARELVTAQTFALGGGKSDAGENFRDAPWARGVIFLAEGDTLYETLVLNLIGYPPKQQVFKYQTRKDRPTWEMPDAFGGETRPLGYLDYLTWPSRRAIFLPPETTEHGPVVTRMRIGQGLGLPKDDIRDPMKREHKIEKPKPGQSPYAPLVFTPGRALWRDSATLFDRQSQKTRRPLVCDWLAGLADEGYLQDPRHKYRLMAFGMAADQASIEFARAERLPLRLEFLSGDVLVDKLRQATTDAGRAGSALRRAFRTLAMGLVKQVKSSAPSPETSAKRKSKPVAEVEEEDEQTALDEKDPLADPLMKSWDAETPYWGALEGEFHIFVNRLANAANDNDQQDAALKTWRELLHHKARETFELAVEQYVGGSPRALKAVFDARFRLGAELNRALGKQAASSKEKIA